VRLLVGKIAGREKVEPEQVLLAWAKAKGAVVVTTVTPRPPLASYTNTIYAATLAQSSTASRAISMPATLVRAPCASRPSARSSAIHTAIFASDIAVIYEAGHNAPGRAATHAMVLPAAPAPVLAE
jgi:hypothetical protein